MAESKLPVRRSSELPSSLADIGRPDALTPGNAWAGPGRWVLNRNRRTVEASTAYLKARTDQSDAYTALLDARVRVMRKIGELADLHNVINEEQRHRDHERWQAERKRQHDRMQADYDDQLAVARNEAALERTRETAIRAQRNREAAERLKQSEIDAWYHAAQARRNNALADSQDTAADLGRVADADSVLKQRAFDLATLDDQIELERQRGNEAALLALLNLRARLGAR